MELSEVLESGGAVIGDEEAPPRQSLRRRAYPFPNRIQTWDPMQIISPYPDAIEINRNPYKLSRLGHSFTFSLQYIFLSRSSLYFNYLYFKNFSMKQQIQSIAHYKSFYVENSYKPFS